MIQPEWTASGRRFLSAARAACVCLLLLLTAAPGFSGELPAASRTLILGDGHSVYPLSPRVDVLEDSGRRLSIDEVTSPPFSGHFTPYHGKILHLGINRSAWWIRFTIVDSTASVPRYPSPRWMLNVPWPYITSVRFFGPRGEDPSGKGARWMIMESGAPGFLRPGSRPAVVPVFPLPRARSLPQTCYLRVESVSSLYLPLEICTQDAQMNRAKLKVFWIGIYSGIIAALALYNIFLFISLRDRSYLWYVGYVIFLGLFFLGFTGGAREYFFPGDQRLAARMIFAFMGCSLISSALFARTFLGTRKAVPRVDRALLGGVGGMLLALVSVPFLDPRVLANLFTGFGILFPLAFIGTGTALLRKKFFAARFFIFSWVVYAASGLVFLLVFRGIVVLPPWGFSIFHGGSAIHAILLSFALADRIRTIEHEREAARRSERRYQELALTDSLSGLYNSRYFRSHLGREVEQAEDAGIPLSLLMLDVDDFKRYNDTWGHPEGDHVLARLGKTILAQTRDADLGCRYGGEEFAVILRGIGEREAGEVAERIRSAFAGEPFAPVTGERVSVTVSIGVAQHIPGNPAPEMVERADRMLYQAKHGGKNRVVGERI